MTEERLKELVPDIKSTCDRNYVPYNKKDVDTQTENLRNAVKALIEQAKLSGEEGWCNICNDHSHTFDCLITNTIEQITGIPYNEIEK